MQIISTNNPGQAVAALTKRLQEELDNGTNVLWLVCGGSNVVLSVQVMAALEPTSTEHLTILLTDERYGFMGHSDSNATQLAAAGFNPQLATMLPVLTVQTNSSQEAAQQHYAMIAKQAFQSADFIIGQFGIGGDGHIAGILPGSAAIDSPDFVAVYPSAPYIRMTLTFHALKRLAVAYAIVFGGDKATALTQLRDETLSYNEQPAQVLKELPEAYVYTDQLEQVT